MSPEHRTRIADLIEELQSTGRYTVTSQEFERRIGGSAIARRSAIRRLRQKGRLVSPRRGFHVIVPLEYRATGSLPASWFVDDLMRYLEQPYYVGLLSAAVVHGASHQHPQVFQVVTSQPTPAMKAGRIRLEFYRKRNLDRVATVLSPTDTGTMRVSTAEATAFDLIRHVANVGHLSNVATVLSELGDVMTSERLIEAAAVARLSEVQRAGYLLELVHRDDLAQALNAFVENHDARWVPLRPDALSTGMPRLERWKLIVNESVEPDL